MSQLSSYQGFSISAQQSHGLAIIITSGSIEMQLTEIFIIDNPGINKRNYAKIRPRSLSLNATVDIDTENTASLLAHIGYQLHYQKTFDLNDLLLQPVKIHISKNTTGSRNGLLNLT